MKPNVCLNVCTSYIKPTIYTRSRRREGRREKSAAKMRNARRFKVKSWYLCVVDIFFKGTALDILSSQDTYTFREAALRSGRISAGMWASKQKVGMKRVWNVELLTLTVHRRRDVSMHCEPVNPPAGLPENWKPTPHKSEASKKDTEPRPRYNKLLK